MNQTSILIIGSNGQLGRELQRKYPEARAVDVKELDITNESSVGSFDFSDTAVIINAAAYTNVDGAETAEGRIAAWKVNALGARNLAKVASKHHLILVHISTDYVFDGSVDNHKEDEPFSPLGVYGQTKAAGDIAVSLTPQHYILRTSWVIGQGKNFVRTMLELGKKGVDPKVVADQIGRLTFTCELVRAINHLLGANPEFGTYNATNSGKPVSWAEVSREVFQLADYNLNVTDTTTAEYFAERPDSAPRPLNSTLELTKLEQTGFVPRNWRDDLKNYIKMELA